LYICGCQRLWAYAHDGVAGIDSGGAFQIGEAMQLIFVGRQPNSILLIPRNSKINLLKIKSRALDALD
jgi:hypothetical protein